MLPTSIVREYGRLVTNINRKRLRIQTFHRKKTFILLYFAHEKRNLN